MGQIVMARAGGVGESGRFPLPPPRSVAVGAARVRGDEELRRRWAGDAADGAPPAADGRDGERRGVAVVAHRHPARVGAQVVDTVRHGVTLVATLVAGEVVDVDPARVTDRAPGLARVGVLADQFLLLRLDTDHGLSRGEGGADLAC
jgi:hypothetical protein